MADGQESAPNTGTAASAYDDWVHRSLGQHPADFQQAAPIGKPLTLGLTDAEAAKCRQLLDARTELIVKPGGAAVRQEDYQPTLDGTPCAVDDIVSAAMQLTGAGFSAANGGDTTGPYYMGTLSQVSDMVNRHVRERAMARAQAALKLPDTSQAPAVPETVARADVQSMLTVFLKAVMKEQKLTAVRITEPVRLAVLALTKGLPGPSTGIAGSLGPSSPGDPGQLAAYICKQLPDTIPRANADALQGLSPREAKAANQSAADAIAGLFSKEVNAAVGLLPKDWQDTIKGAVADAIAAGLVGIAKQAMSQSPLDETTKKAILGVVEGAIKLKEAGPPMDRKQEGEGSPDANPPPPAAAPPPQADPKPPEVPDETILKTPPINTPDTPPDRPKPPEGAAPGT